MVNEDYICHHGIKGQRWGVRRFQQNNKQIRRDKNVNYRMSEKNDKKYGKRQKRKKIFKALIAAGVSALTIYGGYKLITSSKAGKDFIKGGKEAVKDVFLTTVLSKSVERTQTGENKPLVNPAALEFLRKKGGK